MDDARHTLAVARTAAAYGAHVITYAKVTGVRTGPDGRATGVTADDVQGGGDLRRLGPGRRERGRRVGGGDPAARRRAHVHHRPGQGGAPARPQGGVRLDDGHPVEGRGLGDHPAQVVRPLAAGHHRHPLRRRQEQPDGREGGHRLPAAQRQQAAAPQDRARRPAGHLRRAAPAARPRGGGREVHLGPVPRPRRDRGADRDGDDRRGQVHDLPAHGPRRRRRRGQVAGPRDPAHADREPPAGRGAGVAGGRATSCRGCRPGTACPSRRCSGCCTATAPSCRTCWRRSRATRRWAVPIDHTAGYLPVEFLYAVTHEGALTLDDVLTRRTHVAIEDPDAGVGARRRGRRPDRPGAGVGRGAAEGGGRGLRGAAAARDDPLRTDVSGGWCPSGTTHRSGSVQTCAGSTCSPVLSVLRHSEQTWRRASRTSPCRAARFLVADMAVHELAGRVAVLVVHRRVDAVVGAAQVVPALGGERDDRRQHQGEPDGDQRRVRLERRAEPAEERDDRDAGGDEHRAEADRVERVEHAAAELRVHRRDLQQVLVEHDVGGDHDDPGHAAVGVEAEDGVEEVEHVGFHQHQRDQQVEPEEHQPARVVLGDAGEGVGPGQRAGVGVGHVDLDLADHDQDDGERHGQPGRHEVLVDLQELVHRLVGDRGAVGDVGDEVDGEEQPDDLLDRAEDDPARTGEDDRGPPAARVLRGLGRHEAQVVDLLGDLRDQRQAHAGGQHHRAEVGGAVAVLALVGEELRDRVGVADQQVDERRHHQDQPQRRGPDLQLGQHLHPVDDQREDDQRGRRVAEPAAACPARAAGPGP